MVARLVLLLALTLTPLAQAAPAPFPKGSAAEQAPVVLKGWLSRDRIPVGEPLGIARQSDWVAAAKAWNIQNPPKVDFRTHILVVHISDDSSRVVRFEIDDSGNLRTVVGPVQIWEGLKAPMLPGFRIQSYPRSQVKTVNGLSLPKP